MVILAVSRSQYGSSIGWDNVIGFFTVQKKIFPEKKWEPNVEKPYHVIPDVYPTVGIRYWCGFPRSIWRITNHFYFLSFVITLSRVASVHKPGRTFTLCTCITCAPLEEEYERQ